MQEEGLCLHNYFNVCTRVTFAGGWLFPFEYVLSGLHLKIPSADAAFKTSFQLDLRIMNKMNKRSSSAAATNYRKVTSTDVAFGPPLQFSIVVLLNHKKQTL